VSGLLVEPGNSNQLIDSLLMVLNDRTRLGLMGREARVRIVEKFSSEAMSKAYCEMYDGILTN
ncbi:MAG: glycosyltransferase, partial [Chitinispirillaceae bacterium]